MDWTPPPPKYSTQEKATRFGNLKRPTLEEELQLKALGAIESDNNPGAVHRTVQNHNTHKDTAAIGEYGLMPASALDTYNLAKKEDELGPEMQDVELYKSKKPSLTIDAINKIKLAEALKHNKALQDEVALSELREVDNRADTESGLPIGWIQGKYYDSRAKMDLKQKEQNPYFLLQHGRDSKYNESKLEAIKKMFSK